MGMAPELIEGNYGPQVDVWSAGIVLYLCMYSLFPFYGHDEDHTKEMIWDRAMDPPFVCAARCVHMPSSDFESFLLEILDKDASTRPTAIEVLSHQYLMEAQVLP